MASRIAPEGTAVDSPCRQALDFPQGDLPQGDLPVGGRLLHYARRWETISPGKWVMSVVSGGYRLEFTSPPSVTSNQRSTVVPSDGPQRRALLSEITQLLTKRAIVPVYPPFRRGFWSTFFLAPKKTGDWRPILNLKPLNKFIKPKRFRMETLASVLACPIKGMWAASLDLSDAYLHVPISPQDQRYLRFKVQGQTYEFRCLPFGLSTSPRVFTLLVRAVAAYLKHRGVNICCYLDDWLIYGPSPLETQCLVELVVSTVRDLGFLINLKKSNMVPTQSPLFLGAQINLTEGIVVPSPERVTNMARCARLLAESQVAPAVAWMKVLGLMASMVDLIPYCRFHMRPIQLHLLAFYRPSRHPISLAVPMSEIAREELWWWTHQPNLTQGVRFPAPPVSHVVTTDASKTGWGGHIHGDSVSGLWSAKETEFHINLLELWAVERTLHHFEEVIVGSHIVVQTDNTTVVAYLNRQGGTRSPRLCLYALRLIGWCKNRQITMRAIHIAGVTNILADDLSRGKVSGPTEWSLAPQVAQTIFEVMYHPSIDLFASHRNHQLPVYCSRGADPQAFAVDALSVDWEGMTAYAFPPISLLTRVVTKIGREDCNVILIAPFWPKHLWFRPMVDLLAAKPRALPEVPDLLRMPGGEVPSLPLEHLQLAAWPLSGNVQRREAFHQKLLHSSPGADESLPSVRIVSVWLPTTHGAVKEVSLPLEPLCH